MRVPEEEQFQRQLEVFGFQLAILAVKEVVLPTLDQLVHLGARLAHTLLHKPTVVELAANIVRGIEEKHPDWTQESRDEEKRWAVAQLLRTMWGGVKPDEVETMLKLAVAKNQETQS